MLGLLPRCEGSRLAPVAGESCPGFSPVRLPPEVSGSSSSGSSFGQSIPCSSESPWRRPLGSAPPLAPACGGVDDRACASWLFARRSPVGARGGSARGSARRGERPRGDRLEHRRSVRRGDGIRDSGRDGRTVVHLPRSQAVHAAVYPQIRSCERESGRAAGGAYEGMEADDVGRGLSRRVGDVFLAPRDSTAREGDVRAAR